MKKLSESDTDTVNSLATQSDHDGATFITGSPEETIELGRRIGAMLVPGDVVALVGELGTGKTCFTKGIALGLGVPAEQFVRSASFVIVNRYDGAYPIWHVDAYRLDSPLDFVALGYEEYIDSECVAVIEWAEKTGDVLPARTVRISFEHLTPTERRIHVDFSGISTARKPQWRRVLGAR